MNAGIGNIGRRIEEDGMGRERWKSREGENMGGTDQKRIVLEYWEKDEKRI